MRKVRKGPGGPKRSKVGKQGTNRFASAPKHSSGSHGGRMEKRLVNKGGKLRGQNG